MCIRDRAGLIFQLALFGPLAGSVGDAGPLLYVGSTFIVLAVLAANLGQPGFRLIALGATLNLLVIVANGGQMPASVEAMQLAHGVAGVPTSEFSNSVLIGPATAFAFLGDIFALPRGVPLANVFSLGDVLIAAGGLLFVFRTMRPRRGQAAQAAAVSSEVSALPSS